MWVFQRNRHFKTYVSTRNSGLEQEFLRYTMDEKRILITGGSGFIGTNLVTHFLALGWQVLNFDIAEPQNLQDSYCWKRADLLDRESVFNEVRTFQPTILLHFGARTDLDEQINIQGYATNFKGSENIVDAVRATNSIKRVIFASSQLVCKLGYIPKHEEDYLPTTLYGESKVRMEEIIRSSNLNVPWIIVRPTSIWGPWFDIPYKTFFMTIAKNYYIHPGKTETRKQWGFVGNAVYQIEKLIDAPVDQVNKKTFYLADYEPTPLREFANKVQLAMGAKKIPTLPAVVLQSAGRLGDGMQKIGWKNPPLTSFRFHNIVTDEIQDLEPLRKVIGPLPYTLDRGVAITAEWLKSKSGSNLQ